MTITIKKLHLAIAVLVVALIAPATALAAHIFTDVTDGAFYADPVEWALDNAITTGSPAGSSTFKPLDGVTRGESVTFLNRYDDNIVQPALSAIDARLAKLEAGRPFAVTARDDNETIVSDEVIVSVSLTAPVAGNVTVISTTSARETVPDEFVTCSITEGSTLDTDFNQRFRTPGTPGGDSQLAGVRVYDVTDGEAVTYNLVCKNLDGGTSSLFDSVLGAIFTPAP